MTSLFELVTRQRKIFNSIKILELLTRDFYLYFNSRVTNSRFLSWLKLSSYKLEIFILINFQRNNIDMKKKKTIYGKREKDLPEVIEWCYFI